MKELFVLLARYNQYADGKVFSILQSLPEESLNKDEGSYFTSLMGLLNHNLVATLLWLNRFRRSSHSFPALANPVLDFNRPDPGKLLHPSLNELRKRQEDVNHVLLDFAGDLTDAVLAQEIVYTDPKGNEARRIIWQGLLHLFNHQTHHRGQISQILDAQKIEHDYSGISALL